MKLEQHLSFFAESDPEIFNFCKKEFRRQEDGLELIASENYTSLAVMQAQGSWLTNKYAEGYPGKRYYGGCAHVDEVESMAIERVKKLFGASFANVQPHSGSQANMAVYMALLKPQDKVLGMDLSQGGHLTHGAKANFSGKLYDIVSYGLDAKSELIDYDAVEEIARREKPKMIIAGASAYSRAIDFARFRQIADGVGAYLMVDMAHIAGLVAAGVHQSPMPHAHVVTSTTHKTLRGPRGGIILTNDADLAKKFNSLIFPGIQGGPLEHVIAAKAVCFGEALQKSFIDYQKQVVLNAQKMSSYLKERGVELVSGGTDNHLVLVKLENLHLTGKEAEALLDKVHITCNKNMIPGDKQSPFVTSGIRLGTPAITTRGFKEKETELVSEFMLKILKNSQDEAILKSVREEVMALCLKFPMYPSLS